MPFLCLLLCVLASLVPLGRLWAQPVLPTRADSGGIALLLHRADAFAKAPAWTVAPLVGRAGGAEQPDWDLTWASGAVLLSDGRLVTLAAVGNRFYRFAPDGRGERVLARQGAGPGEIMAPSGPVLWRGDSVVIVDMANNRVTWFDARQGGHRTMASPRSPAVPPIAPVGVLRSGAIVGSNSFVGSNDTDSMVRQPAPIIVLDPRTSSTRVVTTIPGLELVSSLTANYRGRRSRQSSVVRFTRVARVAAWDSMIVTSSSDAYALDLRDAAGRIRATIRVPVPRRAVTPAMREAALARALKRFNDPASERMIDKAESIRLERLTPSATQLPAHDALLVSGNGLLWVVDARGPLDAGGAATAFRADGAIVGRLTWKGNGVPMAFGADRVVMRELDEDDVVSLAIYRWQRR